MLVLYHTHISEKSCLATHNEKKSLNHTPKFLLWTWRDAYQHAVTTENMSSLW